MHYATTTPEPLLRDRKTAAAMLSISVRALDYLIARGGIDVRRLGGRVLIPTAELHRLATGYPLRASTAPEG